MKKRMKKLFTVMLIVSVMMSMMSISAYAAEVSMPYVCGQTAHTHGGPECYKYDLVCPKHIEHGEDCYTEGELTCTTQIATELACPKTVHEHTDCTVHEHDEECNVLSACLNNTEGHDCVENSEECIFEPVLKCGNITEGHDCVENSEECIFEPVLKCGKELGDYECGLAEHTHDPNLCYKVHEHDMNNEECYTKTFNCEQDEHVHGVECKNVWNGASVSHPVTAGQNGYTFISHYPGGGIGAYEMSNHMVSVNGGVNNDIPQTLIMLDASKNYTWSPSGLYEFGASNYEVMYCCDAVTGYNDSIYYKRMNLEDSSYYNDEAAAHIRAIITNAYPFVSLDQMKANLAAEGFEGAADLTRADVIAAVQAAVWAYANDGVEYDYSQTFDVSANTQWGRVFHDYTNEMRYSKEGIFWPQTKRGFETDETVGARINALADHLKAKDKVYADLYQIAVTKLEIVDTIPVQEEDGVYNVVIQVVLNNGGSSVNDNIKIEITVDGEVVKTEKPELGKTVYDFTIPVKAGQAIDAVVSGTQILPQGVYFYEPEGGRDISQSLVGVAAGATEIYARAEKPVIPNLPGAEVKANLNLQKVGSFGQILNGAEFELSVIKDGDTYTVDTYTVDGNGQLAVENLLPGTYQLVETAAPEGFQKLSAPVEFTVSDEGEVALVSNAGNMAYITGDVLNVRNNPVVIPYYPPVTPETPETPETPAETPEEPPLVEVEDPEIPLEGLEEPDVPLADFEEFEEIEEMEAPLSDVPKTADNTNLMLWLTMAALSAMALLAMRLTEKKEY